MDLVALEKREQPRSFHRAALPETVEISVQLNHSRHYSAERDRYLPRFSVLLGCGEYHRYVCTSTIPNL